MDLTQEAMTNRLTWRRFLVLLSNLPPDSAFKRWIQDRSNRSLAEWDETDLSRQFGGVT